MKKYVRAMNQEPGNRINMTANPDSCYPDSWLLHPVSNTKYK